MVSDTFELTALPEAFRAQRARRVPGKVVISLGVPLSLPEPAPGS